MADRRAARTGRGAAAGAPPADVRWMNAGAAVLSAAAIALLLGAGLARAARAPALDLRAIRLEGDLQRNSAAQVRATVAHRLKGNFATLDLQQARTAFESLPWVRQAVVSRQWPGRIVARLQEHQPAAIWAAEDGNDRLVNTHGEIFEANLGDVEELGLPVLAGPAARASELLQMHQRLKPLLERAGGTLERLELSARGSWRAQLDNGAAIELGRGNDAEVLERAARLARTVEQVTARFGRPLLAADLRHADGYAVRLAGVVTQPAASEPAPRPPAARR